MHSPLERDAQRTIIELARTLGWRVAHFRPAETKKGWRTPVEADGAGFPDLVLTRDRVIFAELKREGKSPRQDQVEWLNGLAKAGAEVYVWTLADYDEIVRVLSQRVPRTRKRVSQFAPEIAARDGGWACRYCGVQLASVEHTPERVEPSGDAYVCRPGYEFVTVDHVVPRAHGGSDELENLVLACSRCNSRKGVKSQEEFAG